MQTTSADRQGARAESRLHRLALEQSRRHDRAAAKREIEFLRRWARASRLQGAVQPERGRHKLRADCLAREGKERSSASAPPSGVSDLSYNTGLLARVSLDTRFLRPLHLLVRARARSLLALREFRPRSGTGVILNKGVAR